ncbi:hypothetical protein Y032_0030g2019 [Ancylostoma ceylanicum]|uniref:Uncharacterized protein n=1 Tax=Ancylostoma ceylanicum TaxID=53326 RepID=A0A016UR48_9BILA|nr:hypothetical protein Y032_0030g2019 [Ancylostoma ceylanicum]
MKNGWKLMRSIREVCSRQAELGLSLSLTSWPLYQTYNFLVRLSLASFFKHLLWLKQISSLYKAISEPFAVNCVGKTRIHAFAHANTSSECTSTFRPGIKAAQEKKETPRDDKKFLFWSPELCIP